jgi:hypothetical protein
MSRATVLSMEAGRFSTGHRSRRVLFTFQETTARDARPSRLTARIRAGHDDLARRASACPQTERDPPWSPRSSTTFRWLWPRPSASAPDRPGGPSRNWPTWSSLRSRTIVRRSARGGSPPAPNTCPATKAPSPSRSARSTGKLWSRSATATSTWPFIFSSKTRRQLRHIRSALVTRDSSRRVSGDLERNS